MSPVCINVMVSNSLGRYNKEAQADKFFYSNQKHPMGMENPFGALPANQAEELPKTEQAERAFTAEEVVADMRAILELGADAAVVIRDKKTTSEGLLYALDFTIEGLPDKYLTFAAKGMYGQYHQSATTRVDWSWEDGMGGGQVAEYLGNVWVKKG